MSARTALWGLGALTLGLGACGSAAQPQPGAPSKAAVARSVDGEDSAVTATAPVVDGYVINDADGDRDDGHYGDSSVRAPLKDETGQLSKMGGPAQPAQTHAIASVVKRYYAAMSAGEVAHACALLIASLSSAPGGCMKTLASLLRIEHAQLLADRVSSMTVLTVHARDGLGIALLGFRDAPERSIVVQREGSVWKIAAFTDGAVQ